MPQTLEKDEALRSSLWKVFRSSSRDHLTPLTGVGRRLVRIKVAEALPAGGTFEGVALSDEERASRQAATGKVRASVFERAGDRPLGVTRHIVYDLVTQVGNPDPLEVGEEEFEIGVAPFDGFLTEMFLQLQAGAVAQAIAFRTSGGQTVFMTRDYTPIVLGTGGAQPDFLPILDLNFTPAPFELRNLRVPVRAGERVFAIARLGPLFPPGAGIGAGVIGFEAFILAPTGTAAAASAFLALDAQAIAAARQSADLSGRLAIEREKTRRATEVERLRVEAARVAMETKQIASQPIRNPFNQVILDPTAQTRIRSRAPVMPPPPPPFAAAPAAPSGVGQVFVQAWQPSINSIGYLIPEAPRGGRVNVFDSKYTIWDVTGQMVGQGQITPVASTADIPPAARISPMRGGSPPAGLALTAAGVSAGATAAGLVAGEQFPLP